LPEKTNLANDLEGLHPILDSMTTAFWRMRMVVEREAKTIPIKLLVLSLTGEEEGISPGGICGRLGLEFSRISRLIKSLEGEGLMWRERDSNDRRFSHLYLTEKGREYLHERAALSNRELDRRLGELGPEEVRELERMLRIVAEGMRL
jgi:MarR family transcriptional regulator, organic hydroperoxide resistance regulator